MTIKEIEQLIKDEDAGVLRKPAPALNKPRRDLNRGSEILTIIVKYILSNKDRDVFLTSACGKLIIKRAEIQDINCVDHQYGMYEIKTKLGDGIFFNTLRLFEDGKYPVWIKPGFCYSNTYAHIMTEELKAKILSGIVYLGAGKPFLHSVILHNDDTIIDFNYNLVMSKELYFSLFNMEVLAELESEKIISSKEFCLKNPEIFSKFKSYDINFAFDEVMEKAKERYNTTEREVGV